jgi:hypothetical protein
MISRRTITIALSLFVICVSSWSNAAAQDKKTIIRRITLAKEPIEVSYTLKGQPLKAKPIIDATEGIRGEEFEADQDWLNDLTIRLRNVSDKTITYVVLNLHFPEVIANGRTAVDQIVIGVDPYGKFLRPKLKLAPNETIQIPLSTRYEDIRTLVKLVSNLTPQAVTKLWVEFHAALLDDDILFEAGTLYRRNPNQDDAKKWIPIDN